MVVFNMFKELFEPINIGKVVIKNRIVMPAMVMCYAGLHGEVTEQLLSHFNIISRGGVGLVITEAAYIRVDGKGFECELAIDDDSKIPGLARLARIIKVNGASAAQQIYHGGIQARGDHLVGPTSIPRRFAPSKAKPKELSIDEIEELIKLFADAAYRAKVAGFDVIEVHGSHGYLIAQFLSPLTNKRSDKYGVDRELFAIEIIDEIKRKCGVDYPIIFRLAANEFIDGGITIKDAISITKKLEDHGVDAINVTGGNYDSSDHIIPPIYYDNQGYFIKYAAEIKRNISIPVISGGLISDPNIANKFIKEKMVDMIFIGRQLLADPYWPKKVYNNKVEEIRPCIACNECINSINENRPVICTVNPLKGLEYIYKDEDQLPKAKVKKKILVVGSGPAGMEFARIAKIRGHDVVIIDSGDDIGGTLKLSSIPKFKARIRRLIEWYRYQLKKLNVSIYLKRSFTEDIINEVKPDAIIIATGAKPIKPKIKGIENSILADEILVGKIKPKDDVVIIGGGLVGCETAIYLAEKGVKVTIVEALSKLAPNEPTINRVVILKLLKKYNVKILTESPVIEIGKDYVKVKNKSGKISKIKCNQVINALGRRENIPANIENLRKLIKEVYVIGDAKSPRKIINAIHEGFSIALNI